MISPKTQGQSHSPHFWQYCPSLGKSLWLTAATPKPLASASSLAQSDLPKLVLWKSSATLQTLKTSTGQHSTTAELFNACQGLQTLNVYIKENTYRIVWALKAKRSSNPQLAWMVVITYLQGPVLQGCPCKLVTPVSRHCMAKCCSSGKQVIYGARRRCKKKRCNT